MSQRLLRVGTNLGNRVNLCQLPDLVQRASKLTVDWTRVRQWVDNREVPATPISYRGAERVYWRIDEVVAEWLREHTVALPLQVSMLVSRNTHLL